MIFGHADFCRVCAGVGMGAACPPCTGTYAGAGASAALFTGMYPAAASVRVEPVASCVYPGSGGVVTAPSVLVDASPASAPRCPSVSTVVHSLNAAGATSLPQRRQTDCFSSNAAPHFAQFAICHLPIFQSALGSADNKISADRERQRLILP